MKIEWSKNIKLRPNHTDSLVATLSRVEFFFEISLSLSRQGILVEEKRPDAEHEHLKLHKHLNHNC